MQKQGRKVAWIDAEYAWSEEYAEKVGINTKDLLLFQPESAEQGIDILQKLTESGEVSLICVDSTAALVPEAELDGEIRDAQVALQARILSKGLRMVTGTASRNKTTILFISQMRSKIGFTGYGEKNTTSGGKALAFYSSVRLEVARISSFKGKKDEVIGNRLKVTAKKNKVGLPFRSAEIDLKFGSGIDIYTDIFDVAVNNGIIAKDGLSFSYAKNKLAVGREASVDFLRSNVDIYNSIKEQVMLIGKDKDDKEIKQIKNKK
jgi:recombination protein RecA